MKIFGKILCFLGFHSYKNSSHYFRFDSNILDSESYCKRCGKTKKWNKPI